MKPALFALLCTLCALAIGQIPPIIPAPLQIREGTGRFVAVPGDAVSFDGCERSFADYALSVLKLSEGKGGRIKFRVHKGLATLGSEGYALRVNPDEIVVEAPSTGGLVNGLQTLRQLLPTEIETGSWSRRGAAIPCLQIWDEPRFRWRGLHLDVSRHFFNTAFIKRYLDLMALQKLNVFHWHLVDDGGWRVEIKNHPKLTEVGAFRSLMEPLWGQKFLRFPGPDSGEQLYGGFYKQEEIRDIIAYAKVRNIEVIPEIELPGHTQPVMWAYPELACDGNQTEAFREHSGNQRPNVYCAGKEETFEFLEQVLTEVSGLFPADTIHIGGDEVDKFLWEHCPRCQERMKSEGLKDTNELQSYFIRRVAAMLRKHGKKIIGWDEILEGGLEPTASVMSWRGVSGGIQAAQAAHEVVMSPTSHCYFDYSYQNISTETAFQFNPIPEDLSRLEAQYVIGGQANVWTEWIADERRAEQMIFPRILGMSEALWSASPTRDYREFEGRLRAFYPRLNALKVHYQVPVPTAEFDAILLNGNAHVRFEVTPVPGAQVRYTLDGSEPTADSLVATGAIAVEKPGTLIAALFLPAGQRSDTVKVDCAAMPASPSVPLEPGLKMRSLKGKFERVPDFGASEPSPWRNVTEPGLFEFDDTEEFALEFHGYFNAPTAGVYEFSTTSDDGSVLEIAGATVVDNDGLHGPVEKTGRIYLPAGTYPLRIAMFEASGGDVLETRVKGPGITRQLLGGNMILRPKA